MHPALAFLAALLVTMPAARASVYITSPVQSTAWTAGAQTVTWQDNGEAPSLATMGTIDILLYTGGATTQELLGALVEGTPATSGSITVTIPPTAGPNAHDYFLRVRRTGETDLTLDNFSGRFALSGMTGAFSADILAVNAEYDAANPAGAAVAATTGAAVAVVATAPAAAAAPVAATAAAVAPAASGFTLTTTVATAVVTSTQYPSGRSSVAGGAAAASAGVSTTVGAAAASGTTTKSTSSAGRVAASSVLLGAGLAIFGLVLTFYAG